MCRYGSIQENLPRFLFPVEFERSLSNSFSPRVPTESEKRRYACSLMDIRMPQLDHSHLEMAVMLHEGVVREVRDYSDGTILVRMDMKELAEDEMVHAPEYQTWLRLDADGNLISYTFVLSDMRPDDILFVRLDGKIDVSISSRDVSAVRGLVRHLEGGRVMGVGLTPDKVRYIRIVPRERSKDMGFDVNFEYFYRPWWFCKLNLSLEDVTRLLSIFATSGYGEFLDSCVWNYYEPGEYGKLGVMSRLTGHLYIAECFGRSDVKKLLERIELPRDRIGSLWVPRVGGSWSEAMMSLYNFASRGKIPTGEGVSRKLTDREAQYVLVLAALEGNEYARNAVYQRFGIRLRSYGQELVNSAGFSQRI